MCSRRIDLTGQKLGRLLVMAYVGNTDNGEAIWRCVCECGTECTALGKNLRSGGTRSCGCLRSEANRRTIKHRKRNGQ